jgi:hypothetical protein
MGRPRTIILVVISANSLLAIQVVIKLANRNDFRHRRTLDILTKPDKMNNYDSEKAYFKVA